jgi:hypothetical protein
MHQQLSGYKVEEKLYLGVREQKSLNTAGLWHLPTRFSASIQNKPSCLWFFTKLFIVDLAGMLRRSIFFPVFPLLHAVWEVNPVGSHKKHTLLQRVRHDAAALRSSLTHSYLRLTCHIARMKPVTHGWTCHEMLLKLRVLWRESVLLFAILVTCLDFVLHESPCIILTRC